MDVVPRLFDAAIGVGFRGDLGLAAAITCAGEQCEARQVAGVGILGLARIAAIGIARSNQAARDVIIIILCRAHRLGNAVLADDFNRRTFAADQV